MRRFDVSEEKKQTLIEEIDKYCEELKKKYKSLVNANIKDGTIKFSETKTFGEKQKDNLTDEEKKRFALVTFRPLAFAKMVALIEKCTSEVAWYGLTHKNDNEIIIDDIIVYDQTVTKGTVESTEEQQMKFFDEQPDEVLNAIHSQMHSHVNFACRPSGTDEEQQEDTVRNLGDGQYFLFMIWNKKLEHYAIVYDSSENLIYEDEDIIVDIADEEQNSAALFAEEELKKVTKKEVWQASKSSSSTYTTTTSRYVNDDAGYSNDKWWTSPSYGSYY